MFWVYPEALVLASSDQISSQNQPLVFEVKNQILNNTGKNTLTIDELASNDPLVNNLKIYLQKYNSPLAEYADQMILLPQWQRALAISWVESNFCRNDVDNNCSGIGVAPGHKLWRKYENNLEWFKDMTALMEKPLYKERFKTFKQMKGVYVQPGSMKWVNGAQQKYNELVKLTEESEKQREIIAQKEAHKLALATFPQMTEVE